MLHPSTTRYSLLKKIFPYQVLILCCLLMFPLPALAVATLSIAPAGDGIFLLSGSDLDGVAGIEVTVSYDTALLTNPRVSQGTLLNGAVMTANTGSAGRIHLAAVSGKSFDRNGSIATFSFQRVGASAGMITSLTGKLASVSGGALPVLFSVANPPPPPDPLDDLPLQDNKTASAAQEQNTVTSPTTGAAGRIGGTLTMPAETGVAMEVSEQPEPPAEPRDTVTTQEPAASVPAASKEAALPAKTPKAPVEPVEAVLERFRLFTGERSAKKLMALFDSGRSTAFRQEPPVVIADGASTVKVALFSLGDKTPKFLFSHGRYVSSEKGADGEWIVEMRPDAGALAAGITVLMDGLREEIPLAVSPKARVDLITAGKTSAADFALFLKERGTSSAPRFDLNGDGKRDYVDDYIFTANYLVEEEKQSGKRAIMQKAPIGPTPP